MHLLSSIEKFLRRSGTPPTRFGREAMGDPRFVLDLRNGREPRASTVCKVRDYLAQQQTEGGR